MLTFITNWLCPPTKSPRLRLAEAQFTPSELSALQTEHCCHVLSQYTGVIDDKHFLEWAGLQHAAPVLQQGLCNAVRWQSGGDGVSITLDGVICAKAMAEKLDRLSAEDFAWDVLSVDENTAAVPEQHMAAIVAGCLSLAFHHSNSDSGGACTDHSATAAAIAAGACAGDAGAQLTRDGYSKLCKLSPALNTALTSLLCNIGASAHSDSQQPANAAAGLKAPRPLPSPASSASRLAGNSSSNSSSRANLPLAGSRQGLDAAAAAVTPAVPRRPGCMQLPQLGWGLCSPHDGLLQPGWVWLLAASLPPQLQQEWRLLYSSFRHGMSFSTLLGRLGAACPTLLLIRDKQGAVFGGIAHRPWAKTGQFYGDYASCIFSLLPTARLYPAAGINGHLQWCGVGFKELPNGVGFGGQVGHFAVWLDATLDTGMSRPSATFASPCLASSQTFAVEAVEVWLLSPPEDEDAAAGQKGTGSVLGKATEDQRILELAGARTNYSAALKDEPIED